jgi:hypothetical protein
LIEQDKDVQLRTTQQDKDVLNEQDKNVLLRTTQQDKNVLNTACRSTQNFSENMIGNCWEVSVIAVNFFLLLYTGNLGTITELIDTCHFMKA